MQGRRRVLTGVFIAVLLLTAACHGSGPSGAPEPGDDDGAHPEAITVTEEFWSGGERVELTAHVGPLVRSRTEGALQVRFDVTSGTGVALNLAALLGTPDGRGVLDARLVDAEGFTVHEPMRQEGVTPLSMFLDGPQVEGGGGPAQWVGHYSMRREEEAPVHVLLPYFGLVEDVHVQVGAVAEVPGMEELRTDQIMTTETFPFEQRSEPAANAPRASGPVGAHDATVEITDPHGQYGAAAVHVQQVRRVDGLLVGRIAVHQVGDQGAPHGAAWALYAGRGAAGGAGGDDGGEQHAQEAEDVRAADAPTVLADGLRVFPIAYDVSGHPGRSALMPLADREFGYEDLQGAGQGATATVIWPDVGAEVITVDVPDRAGTGPPAHDLHPWRVLDVPVQ